MSNALGETEIEVPIETFPIHKEKDPSRQASRLPPHRIVLILIGLALVASAALFMRWDWLPQYGGLILQGLWRTIWILVVTVVLGFLLAVPLGLAQASGPAILAIPARAFCTVIRGTPLLVQLWLLYYGLGSLFPQYPWIRGSELWPYLRQAWPYAVLALTLSYAGYEGRGDARRFCERSQGAVGSGAGFRHAALYNLPSHLAAASYPPSPAYACRRGRASAEIHPAGRDDHGR